MHWAMVSEIKLMVLIKNKLLKLFIINLENIIGYRIYNKYYFRGQKNVKLQKI